MKLPLRALYSTATASTLKENINKQNYYFIAELKPNMCPL